MIPFDLVEGPKHRMTPGEAGETDLRTTVHDLVYLDRVCNHCRLSGEMERFV